MLVIREFLERLCELPNSTSPTRLHATLIMTKDPHSNWTPALPKTSFV